jgi:hypothetical protein
MVFIKEGFFAVSSTVMTFSEDVFIFLGHPLLKSFFFYLCT